MMSDPRLGPKLDEGRTAEIYAWEPGWVLKLYRDWVPAEDAIHEAEVTRAAHTSGFAAPAIGEIVEVDGRTGLEMEHIQGADMFAAMLAKPWQVDRFARQMAELHLRMHSHRPQGLPDQHAVLRIRLKKTPFLDEDLRGRLLERLETLPAGDSLLHGDLHPLNVILTPTGPAVIDWIDAKCGNPLADVARSTILFTIGHPSSNPFERLFITLFRQRFHAVYLKAYFANRPDARAEYRQWLPIMAANRLNEGITEDNPALLAAAQRWMAA